MHLRIVMISEASISRFRIQRDAYALFDINNILM